MFPRPTAYSVFSPAGSPFLPLAFRVGATFTLLVVHLAFPSETLTPAPGDGVYVLILLALLAESLWEVSQNVQRHGSLFATPGRRWILWNLALDILLIATMISFQGVDQERFATVYIFPVLAGAFYLRITEIVGVGTFSALVHVTTVLLFASGLLPPFGKSGGGTETLAGQYRFILGYASLQIFAATLVVVLIRKHLESLRKDLQQSEAAVDKLSALYRRVFDSLFAGLITTDLQGRITSANPAAEQILRRSLKPGEDVEGLVDVDITSHGLHMKERRFETSFLGPGGHKHLVGGNVAPIRDLQGNQTGFLLLFQDLTDLKLLEDRTRLAERMATVGELAAGLAHEIRNPMASILGCVQLLRRGEPAPLLLDRALTILQRESERVSAIVTDFLAFAKPRASRIQHLWFPTIVEEVQASWDTDPRCEGLPLHGEVPPEVWVIGDPLAVHQVFTNLLSNARKAVAGLDRPSITLGFQVGELTLGVSVIDNGCGMDTHQLQSLFLPFTTGFDQGTGLGMSLVYQFVKQMEWEIAVESSPGLGTTVRLTLPLARAEQATNTDNP